MCAISTVALVTLVLYYLRASRAAAGEFGFPLDDSWIHVRFAEHLAAGKGFAFNPGQPTSTTTGALWTLLLAACYRLTREFLFTSVAVNCLLAIILCVLSYHLTLAMTGSSGAALAAGALMAVTVPLPWWILSGMEPVLHATLATLGVLLHLRAISLAGPGVVGQARGRGLHFAATGVFALAGLARPECFLLFPLAMLDRVVMSAGVRSEKRAWGWWVRELWSHGVLSVLIAAPWFAYNLWASGYLLPSSFYSKQQWMSISGALATGQLSALLRVVAIAPWKQLGSLVSAWVGNNPALVAPFCVGLVWLVYQALRSDPLRGSLLIPLALIVQPVTWALVTGYRQADFQSQRYIAALSVLYVTVAVSGGWWALTRGRLRKVAWARVALAVGVIALALARQPASAATYARNVKNITEMQVTIARWLRDRAPRQALLAVNDVGAMGVIAGNPVLDLQGLVTPEVLPLRSARRRAEGTAPEALSRYLFERRPDYLVIFPRWYPELDARRDLFTPVFVVALSDNITCGDSVMVVYQTVWGRARHGEAKP